jgi:murein L,D-transpeptidase YafK
MADRTGTDRPLSGARAHTPTRRWHKVLAAGILAAALLPWSASAFLGASPARLAAPALPNARDTEGLLIRSLLEITQGRTTAALSTLDELLSAVPNFKLAHLVRGDLLMAQSHELSGFGNAPNAPKQEIADFREEARVRLERYLSQQNAHNIPEYLWQLDRDQRYAIVVDTAKSRLYLYRNESGAPRYVADYYVTVGKNGSGKQKEGDKRTPLGIYFTGAQLQQKKLSDLYGSAAYPLSYPNEWDRHQGMDGHGIWLHGTPSDTYSRPPRASDGCVVLTNPDIKTIGPILQSGKTPVVIASNVQWLASEHLAAERNDLLQAVEQWRRDWEAQDTDSYLAHYSQTFFSADHNFSSWAADKRRKQASKPSVKIGLSNISMFRYPDDQQQMVVVNFDQAFKSNVLDNQMRKRQYWVLENKHWKILYEGAA